MKKKIPAPLTATQIKEKLKNKKMKIEFAPTTIIKQTQTLGLVLDAIKEVMGISGIVVSDESMLSDFSPDASEVAEIGRTLGIEIKRSDYIYEIALRLKPSN